MGVPSPVLAQGAAPPLVVTATEVEEPLDPWIELAQRLRLHWTRTQQDALARALRHAPNHAAVIVMPQALGVAQWC